MTSTTKQKPIARLLYRAVVGKDDQGRDIFQKQGTEVASIWASKSGRADVVRFKGVLPTKFDEGQFLIIATNFKSGGAQ